MGKELLKFLLAQVAYFLMLDREKVGHKVDGLEKCKNEYLQAGQALSATGHRLIGESEPVSPPCKPAEKVEPPKEAVVEKKTKP